jgi:hypothetical protein
MSLEARSTASQDPQQAPSPPEPNYDPVPGPFLVTVDGQGAVNDAGVIANATRSWRGPKLSAFLLCFQPASKPVDWAVAMDALDNTSRELHAHGADIVVIDPMRVCPSPPVASVAGKAHVEVRGVIRGRD